VASLQALARTGYYLYQKLFYAPGSKPEVRALGNLLQQLSSQRRLRIQVTDDHYNFPWMLLYDRPTLDLKAIDAESFWGFKHLIENLPSAGDSPPDDLNNLIRVDDGISFGWVYDTGLDNLVGQPAIAQQREFLSALPNVALSEHPNRQDLFDLLNNPDAPAQLLYVLCPLSAKKLRMSDAPVSLDELSIFAPTSDPALKQRPLVFVNGLLSAADSPYLHDGLLPYLIAKGARGVIGAYATELPFFFAAEFAQAFFERCTAGGQSVGEILYELRRAYVREKSNVLGLIYALYGSADIVFQARQRAIKLTIDRQGNEYLFTLHDEGQASAIINLSDAQIADLVERARKTMNTILMTQVNDEYVYQAEHPAVPADVHVETLKSLAKTGYYLYERLFYAPGSSPAARAMGEQLRRLSQENRLQIEISTERFSFPWMLLYDRAPLDLEQIDLEHFWGFKHIVNYTLGYDTVPAIASDSLIVVGDTLPIGFVLNSTIDTQFGQPIVQKQGDRLRALPQVVVREYPNCQDLLDVLNNPDAPEQLFYFYCHGVKGTTLALSDGRVHVDDLQIFAPTSGPPLKQAPLMFMNAIDSARLSPYLYDGLVPYLLERGARTIIGVEAEIGIYFAAEFGQEFIRRFIAGGRPAGKLLRDLRREYALKQHNLMGLVYVLYGSGDTVIQKTT
ncbi:MAG TPA: hypothetical protein VFU22_33860, partial [Roseiflexaceae bacterium]|nr:hypothetical protein [Roseiflexaceae bacterium]